LPFFTDMTEEQVDYVCERLAARIGGGVTIRGAA
jgi:hypothetical protein